MISGLALMIAGLVMMAPPRRILVLQPMPGNELREVYMQPTQEPVPQDMLALTRQIAGPLRVVGGRDQ